jgi:hypothetical protein
MQPCICLEMHLCASTVLECSCFRIHRHVAAPFYQSLKEVTTSNFLLIYFLDGHSIIQKYTFIASRYYSGDFDKTGNDSADGVPS